MLIFVGVILLMLEIGCILLAYAFDMDDALRPAHIVSYCCIAVLIVFGTYALTKYI